MINEVECKKSIIELIVGGANKNQVRSILKGQYIKRGLCEELAAAFIEQQLDILTHNIIL